MVLSVPNPLHAEGSFGNGLHGKWNVIAMSGVFLGPVALAGDKLPSGPTLCPHTEHPQAVIPLVPTASLGPIFLVHG